MFCCYDKPQIVGGTTSWIQWLVPELRRRGIDARCMVFLHTGEEGPVTLHMRAEGVPVLTHTMQGYPEDRVQWILRNISEDPCDVFVPNEVPSAYHASRWIRRAGTPTIGVIHTDGLATDAMETLFVKSRGNRAMSAVVCVSRELEARMRRSTRKANEVIRIPCGRRFPLTRSKPLAPIY